MQLVLATNNQDKIREIKNLLDDLPITILTADDFLEFPDPEETGTTLEENAILKAKEIAAFCDMPALADDSGLEVDALDGAPGVYSSRYAGEDATYADNNRKLLKELENVPSDKRSARFRCVIAICWGGDEVAMAELPLCYRHLLGGRLGCDGRGRCRRSYRRGFSGYRGVRVRPGLFLSSRAKALFGDDARGKESRQPSWEGSPERADADYRTAQPDPVKISSQVSFTAANRTRPNIKADVHTCRQQYIINLKVTLSGVEERLY